MKNETRLRKEVLLRVCVVRVISGADVKMTSKALTSNCKNYEVMKDCCTDKQG